MDNELIYHLWNKRLNRNIYKQLCIPRELGPKILSLLHDTNFAGHKGVHKMYEDAIRHFWWNNIYKDMHNYVSSCKLCLKTNTGHSPKIPLNPLEIPSAPFQTLYKPTTNSQCERTNRSIISILRKFVCDNPKNWSNNICYVTYVINTSVSESTKTSPFSLIYDMEATSVLDLCLPEVPENVPKLSNTHINIGLII